MPGKKKKMRAVCICAALVLAVSAFAGVTYVSGKEEPVVEEVKKDILVDTLSPRVGDIAVTGEYIGTIEPSQQVSVIPKVSGEVLAVHFAVGDVVKAGDVLVEVDASNLRHSIAQAQAGISSAAAKTALSLEMARLEQELYNSNLDDGYNASLAGAEANVRNAETAVEQATVSLRTARTQMREFNLDNTYPLSLSSMQGYLDDEQVGRQLRDAVTQSELALEQAQLGLETAKNNLDITKKSLNDSRQNIDNSVRMAELNANLSEAQLQLQQLQDNLSDYTITAPIGGVVEQRSADQFDMISPGVPVYTISDKDSMTVSFKVPQSTHAHMKTGDPVMLEQNGGKYTGAVTEISTMVDNSGLFTIKASIPNPPSDLYTGASVKIYAETQKAESSVLLPLSALYYDNGASYVYIAENGFAKKVFVETGIYDADYIQIISGLSISDRVIGTWNSSLADGVEIVLADSNPGTQTAPEGGGDNGENGQ